MISLARLTWPTRLRAVWPTPRRPAAAASHAAASHGSLRRLDVYILAIVALVATVWFANRSRFVVTHYLVEQNLAYQRTDTWTGRTELWIVGRTSKPQWIGFTDAIPRPTQRRAPAAAAPPAVAAPNPSAVPTGRR